MKDYAYIFTICSGIFAVIQMVRLFYPWLLNITKTLSKPNPSNEKPIETLINTKIGLYVHLTALLLLFVVCILVVYQKSNKISRQFTTSELERKIDSYHSELNDIKIEVSKNIKQTLDSAPSPDNTK